MRRCPGRERAAGLDAGQEPKQQAMITAHCYMRLRESPALELLGRLRATQYWPRERIRQYQLEKLQKLLRHAYDHVPYWRGVMDRCGATPGDVRTFDDFGRLPVLTKQLLREHFDEMTARDLPKQDLVLNATGGSTGEPLQFYQCRQYHRWADGARLRGWYDLAGCRPGDRCAVLWGDVRDVSSDYSLRERLKEMCLRGTVNLNSFNLSEQRMRTFLGWCRWFRPKLLRGYVTAIKEFAAFLDGNQLRFPKLKGIILCAETVDADSQAFIERVFGAISYNTYGGREVSLSAMECPAKNGLHEVSENNYLEFEPIDLPGYPGAGNLLVTNLNNYAMPFLRYRIGDIGIPSTRESCSCGRGLPLIDKVIGRTTEVFEFYDGTKIAGEMFIHLMKEFPLKEYQFVQVSDRKVILRISGADARDRALQSRICDAYRPHVPAGVVIDFEEVSQFERTATGKFRFVFRELRA
jgi:phenylacetate-CoA ligase